MLFLPALSPLPTLSTASCCYGADWNAARSEATLSALCPCEAIHVNPASFKPTVLSRDLRLAGDWADFETAVSCKTVKFEGRAGAADSEDESDDCND